MPVYLLDTIFPIMFFPKPYQMVFLGHSFVAAVHTVTMSNTLSSPFTLFASFLKNSISDKSILEKSALKEGKGKRRGVKGGGILVN
jgi:hypothetical protein